MLGDKLYEIAGKVTGRRIIAGSGAGDVKMEVSFEGTGKVLGIETIETGTYASCMKAPGVMYAEGLGLSLTADGDAVTWHGSGIGVPTGKGMALKVRGAIYYTTSSQKLARLNGTAVVFEWDVDEHGNSKGATWEWK